MKKFLLFVFFVSGIFAANAQRRETNYFTTYGGTVYYEKNLSEVRGDSVIFLTDGTSSAVPVDSLAFYEHKTGNKSGKGLLYGALAGAAIGVAIGAAEDVDGPQTGLIVLDGVLGAVVGGVTGALIGRSRPVTETVDLTLLKGEEKKKIIKALIMDHVSEQ